MRMLFLTLLLMLGVSLVFPRESLAHSGGLVVERTPTASESTQLHLTLLVHGIGRSGDSVNPTGSTLSNKNPLHPSRPVVLQLLTDSQQVVSTIASTMDFQNDGAFVSTVSFPTDISAGSYQVKVRTTGSLWRSIPVNQTLLLGQENNLPEIDLMVGNTNDDNQLDVRDYNLLMLCFTDIGGPSVSCFDQRKQAADITDDGMVNQSDYNLFLREFVSHPESE